MVFTAYIITAGRIPIHPKTTCPCPYGTGGIFYEKMVRSILEGRNPFSVEGTGKGIIRNYWWGMDSGILDFFYSRKLIPAETQKLINFMKESIIEGRFNVFSGPLYDHEHRLKNSRGKSCNTGRDFRYGLARGLH